MKIFLIFFPFLLLLFVIPTIYASCCKLSAFMLRRRVVGWKQCFAFGYILVPLSIVVNIIVSALEAVLPIIVGIFLVLIAQTLVGAMVFSHRGTYANDQPLGWRGGAELAALSLVFSVVIGLAILTGANYLQTLL